MSNGLIETVGEYALLALFFLLFLNIISRAGFTSFRRLAALLALLIVISLASSNLWLPIRRLYIYFFAFMALLGKFAGILEVITRSSRNLGNDFSVAKVLVLFSLAFMIVAIEFADVLLVPAFQPRLSPTWWPSIAWIIPAVGIATALSDSARPAIRSIAPAANTRLLLFLFVFAAGLLVPMYIPTIDHVMRYVAILGVIIGLVMARLNVKPSN